MEKFAVVALGGNALIRSGQIGTIEEQIENTLETLENLIFLVKEGYKLIFTHGNGPQVGNILLRNDAGNQLYNIARMPLDICVADSQGGIGYMVEQCLHNVLIKHNLKREVVSLITEVVVDRNDIAFKNPTKRIGQPVDSAEAEILFENKGWIFKADSKNPGKFRRVVASPTPLSICNEKVIRDIALSGTLTIAVGGGGIPVFKDNQGFFTPAEAVIDKDLASAMLAARIGASELYILTDVPFVYRNFKKENEEIVEFLNYRDAEQMLLSGEFGEGSMAPKVKAALSFIKNGGKKAVITESKKLQNKTFGTKITMEYDPEDKPHHI